MTFIPCAGEKAWERIKLGCFKNQEAQVLQSPELQLEHELVPAPGTALETPPRVALKAAKVDILRRAGLWHLGHSAD